MNHHHQPSVVFALCLTLLAACVPETPQAADETPVLTAASEGPTLVTRDDEGVMVGVTGRFEVPSHVAANPVARADWFLANYGAELGVTDPMAELGMDRTFTASHGDAEDQDTMVVYQRLVDGLVVYGADVRVKVASDGSVRFAVSRIPENITPPTTTPVLSADEAATIAASYVLEGDADGAELVIVNPSLFGRPTDRAYLAYRVEAHSSDPGDSMSVFVDALDGTRVPYETGLVQMDRVRNVYNACAGDYLTMFYGVGEQLYEEAGPFVDARAEACRDVDQDDFAVNSEAAIVYEKLGVIWDYFDSRFERDSYDGEGGAINAYVHFGTAGWNAFHYDDPTFFAFEDGQATPDTIAHEFTHAVTRATAALEYAGESGALNESMSDVFAAFVDPEGTPWAYDGTTRNLSNPHDSDPVEGFVLPRHMSDRPAFTEEEGAGPCEYDSDCGPVECPSFGCTLGQCVGNVCVPQIQGTNDNLGVHINSSIMNHVAYLAVEGAMHADTGIQPAAIGFEKAEQIWYAALQAMGPSTRFAEAREIFNMVAFELAMWNDHGITMADCGSVLNAFAAVGIGETDGDCDCLADDQDEAPNDGECAAPPEEEPPPAECSEERGACSGSGTDFDDECCGDLICVIGTCVSTDLPRERAPCADGFCAEGLTCRLVADAGPERQCCARADDYCETKADCCGQMQCAGNVCELRLSGESCLGAAECPATSICDEGYCS